MSVVVNSETRGGCAVVGVAVVDGASSRCCKLARSGGSQTADESGPV